MTTENKRCVICEMTLDDGVHLCGYVKPTGTTVKTPGRTSSPGVKRPEPLQQGWECVRCRAVNSPYSLQCTCRPG